MQADARVEQEAEAQVDLLLFEAGGQPYVTPAASVSRLLRAPAEGSAADAIDLTQILTGRPGAWTPDAVQVLVHDGGQQCRVIVERVVGLHAAPASEIFDLPPLIRRRLSLPCVRGIARLGPERLVVLLQLERLASAPASG